MKRIFWITSLIVLILGLAGFCPQPARAQPAPDTLRLDLAPPQTIDPALASYTQETQVAVQLFAGLLKDDPATGTVLPGLAESWSWNAARDVITLNLRPGLVWSDGEGLTADDARYGILRALAPETASPYAGILYSIVNAAEYNTGAITDPNLVGVTLLSPTTLQITLIGPSVFFEKILALWVAYPTPEHVINAHPTNWTSPANIVVSGPYTLTQWTANSMRLEPNPHYYDSAAAPDINQVDILLTNDTQQAWNAYLLDQLDTTILTPPNLAAVQADPILAQELHVYAGSCSMGLGFKTNTSPTDNVNVRKALIAAVDRQGMVTTAMAGSGLPTQTFTPPSLFGYVDGAALGIGIPSNATQAQAYLAAAGYPGGAGFPAIALQISDSPANRARWNYLVNAWQSVLNVPITVTYGDSTPGGQPIFFFGWCADYNDAYNFLGDAVSVYRTRLGNWQNAAYNTLLSQMTVETNADNRLPLYQQAEQILVEDEAVLEPLYNNVTLTMTQPYLQRTYTFAGHDPFNAWVIEPEASAAYNPAAALQFDPAVDTTHYTLPAGLLAAPTQLVHTALRGSGIPTFPGLGGIGHAFSLQAEAPPSLQPLQPAETLLPYSITIAYSPQQLDPQNIPDETDLRLYARVGGQWIEQPTLVNTTAHTLTAATRQVNTTFVVWGGSLGAVYLPVIVR